MKYDPQDQTVSKKELDQQYRKMKQFVQHPDWAHEYAFVEKSIEGEDKKVRVENVLRRENGGISPATYGGKMKNKEGNWVAVDVEFTYPVEVLCL